jgi:hypothetical protein
VAGNVNVGGAVLVAVEMAVEVAVDVAVEVAVDVAVGLEWVVSAGVGKSGGDGTAECDERLTRLGETDAGAAGGGALLVGDAALTGDSSGDTPLGTPVSPVAGAFAEPDEDPAPASADRGECDPVSARTVTIPVAMIATRTPTTAAAPDSAIIRRRGAWIACGKPLGRNAPARCVTSRRYDSVSGLESVHTSSTSSRSPGGSTASGAMP